jgi:hypothetical protein
LAWLLRVVRSEDPHRVPQGDPIRVLLTTQRRPMTAWRAPERGRGNCSWHRPEHDSASFGNKMMWLPVALGPVGAVAGVAGFFSQRMAKTALPVASAVIVANGLQGVYLHARGISQKPGGWSNARYNLEMGPPLLAPLLVTMVGGMGLLAATLRREQ